MKHTSNDLPGKECQFKNLIVHHIIASCLFTLDDFNVAKIILFVLMMLNVGANRVGPNRLISMMGIRLSTTTSTHVRVMIVRWTMVMVELMIFWCM